jgi:hypothetical protein
MLLAIVCALLAPPDARLIMEQAFRGAWSRPLRYEGVVEVCSASGARSERRWVVERKGEPGRGRVLLRFTDPPEVKGVALLIAGRPAQTADQWLYTPAIARARRVAAHSRRSRFYSTHLSFEDLQEDDGSAAEYSLAGEEVLDGEPCWRISARPRASSQYDSKTYWVSKSKQIVLRTDLAAGGETVKRVLAHGYRLLQGVWTASRVEVMDLKRGGRTVVELRNVRYDLPLPDDRFTVEALGR